MTEPPPPTDLPHSLRQLIRHGGALTLIIMLCSATEMALLGADWQVWGSPVWRSQSYQYGAFWAGLLHGWQPNYALQPLLMFLTYPFLHSGPTHLVGNMLSLVWLGQIALTRLGTRGFLWLYLASALGGAAVFGLISRSPSPMIGASGAIFGLVGAWTFWDWQRRQHPTLPRSKTLWPTLGILVGLGLFNLANWALLGGMLAWQTHLGGFLAGGSFAALWDAYTRRLPKTRS